MVEELLIAPDQGTQVSGQSEGGHEVWDGQEQGSLLLDPAVDLVVLTLRAMAVLAGVIPVVVVLALGAAVEMTAHGLGAAGADPESVFVITAYELKGKPLAAYRRRRRRRKG